MQQSISEMLVKVMNEIKEKHGVVIISLDAEWYQAQLVGIEITSKLTEAKNGE